MDSGICLFSMKKDFWNIEITKIHTSHACTSYCRHLGRTRQQLRGWPLWVHGRVQGQASPRLGSRGERQSP